MQSGKVPEARVTNSRYYRSSHDYEAHRVQSADPPSRSQAVDKHKVSCI